MVMYCIVRTVTCYVCSMFSETTKRKHRKRKHRKNRGDAEIRHSSGAESSDCIGNNAIFKNKSVSWM